MTDTASLLAVVLLVWGLVAAGLLEAPVRGWWRRRMSGRQAR